MHWLDEKYLLLLSHRLRNFAQKSTSPILYNFSCPYCGDSEKDRSRARGYVYEKEGQGKFKCHNCGATRSRIGFLVKDLDSELYKSFTMERLGHTRRPEPKKSVAIPARPLSQKSKSLRDILFPLTEEERRYLEGRHLPVTDRMHHLSALSDLQTLQIDPDKRLPYGPRLALEIRNREGRTVGFNCRTLDPTESPRYVNVKLLDEEMVFNLDRVSTEERIFVVEGALDSLHLRNSVAVSGADLSKIGSLLPKNQCVLVFDNQPRNPQIVKKMSDAIGSGWSVAIWPERLTGRGKDLNELVLSGIDESSLERTLIENSHSGMLAKMRFEKWRRV